MAIRKIPFVIGEYYHIYNRGTDKRIVFSDEDDINRFLQCMDEFNVLEPIGSIYINSFNELRSEASQLGELVEFVAYCLNPNHYHFIMTPLVEKGIEKFMQRLGTGHTNYFNNKYHRNGSLFQGVYKSSHISNNESLLRLSVYVNLNDRVHKLDQLRSEASQLKLVKSRSSWGEYIGENKGRGDFCNKEIILGQFKNRDEYKKFAECALEDILVEKADLKNMEKLLLE